LPELGAGGASESALDCEAVQLFAARAQNLQHEFRLGAANLETVAEICRRLDGMPLAIELAAACCRWLSVKEISARLDQRFRLLASRDVAALERHRTLLAAVEWSYDLLSIEQRRCFMRLAAFRGHFGLEAAEAVCAGDGIEAERVPDLLAGLADRSLLECRPEPAPSRYRLLETLRAFARERLQERGEADAVGRRHLAYYAAFVDRASGHLGIWAASRASRGSTSSPSRWKNIRGALDWALERDAEAALRMAVGLGRFWEHRCLWTEGKETLERALGRAAEAPDLLVADALRLVGVYLLRQGDYDRALSAFEAGKARCRLHGPSLLEARTLICMGIVWDERGDYARAQALYSDGREISRSIGDDSGVARALVNLAVASNRMGDTQRGQQLLLEALSMFRTLGDRPAEALTLCNLAEVCGSHGDHAAQRRYYQASLALAEELGDVRTVGVCFKGLGDVLCSEGDFERAYWRYVDALNRQHGIGCLFEIALCLEALVRTAARLKAPRRAVSLLGAAASLRQRAKLALSPGDRQDLDALCSNLRADLGNGAFEALLAEGRALSAGEAVALASKAPEAPEAPSSRNGS
jgi:non-specific serine/threonine protein kinase